VRRQGLGLVENLLQGLGRHYPILTPMRSVLRPG
jgi:hypothetical protein